MSYRNEFPDVVWTGNIIMPEMAKASGVAGPDTRTVLVNWLARHAPTSEEQRAYAQERCLAAGTEAIAQSMEVAGLNRAQLAERLGKNPGYITRVLNGTHNMTLRTLGDMLWACDMEVRDLDVRQLGVVEVSSADALDWQLFPEVAVDSRSPPSVEAASAPVFMSLVYPSVQDAA